MMAQTMFRLTRPTPDLVRELLEESAKEPMPACAFGSFDAPTEGFRSACSAFPLGSGDIAFESAVAALRNWLHYAQTWIAVFPNPPRCEVGSTFAVAARTYGCWSVNACRICECIDEPAPDRRFGLTYRTLSRHVELGDARFTVEQRSDDSVWFCVRTVSRMNHPLTRLFRPLGIYAQQRAVAAAARAMSEAIRERPRTPAATPDATLSVADTPRR